MRAVILTTLGLASPALADEPVPPAPASFPVPGPVLPAVAATVPALAIEVPPVGIAEQPAATTGADYGRKGMFELGGSAGMMIAPGFRNVSLAPSFGWFFANNIELSAIAAVGNIKAGDESSTVLSLLVEPSYHSPFTRTLFGFFGAGVGAAYVNDVGAGLAVTLRAGANFLVGRSGVLTPSLSYDYTTHAVRDGEMEEDITVAAVSSSVRINIGYTQMW